MDKLDLRKKYDCKDLAKIINKLIEENIRLQKLEKIDNAPTIIEGSDSE